MMMIIVHRGRNSAQELPVMQWGSLKKGLNISVFEHSTTVT
jgi:hypothetical protein